MGRINLYLTILSLATVIHAGSLDKFEKEAKKSKRSRSTGGNSSRRDHNHHGSRSGRVIGSIISGILSSDDDSHHHHVTTVTTGRSSRLDQPRFESSSSVSMMDARKVGDPVWPFLRFDSSYMYESSDVCAWDNRLEFGVGPVALAFRNTHFWERDPDDELNLLQGHLLLRLAPTPYFEIDLGIGAASLEGTSESGGTSVCWGLLVYPQKNVGFEVRQSLIDLGATGLKDWDFGFHLRHESIGFKIGYRRFEVGDAVLDGPYVGFDLRF